MSSRGLDAESASAEGGRLVQEAAALGVTLRLLGGVAIAASCPSARNGALARTYGDFDFATTRQDGRGLRKVFAAARLVPAERFNAISGHSRLLYYTEDGMKIDVFIETFEQCQTINLAPRLRQREVTLPLADLLLTKLQIAQLTAKDVSDSAALLLDHRLSEDEAGINVRYITQMLAGDWRWWRSATETLDRLTREVPRILDAGKAATVTDRIRDLQAAVDAHPKSLKWRARSAIGDRMSWRTEPEENRA